MPWSHFTFLLSELADAKPNVLGTGGKLRSQMGIIPHFSFPECTTKNWRSLSPNSESVSDECQAALAVAALSPVCFGERDVVFPWVISRVLISIQRQKPEERRVI